MYQYDAFDAQIVRARATQFRYQVERRLSGRLSEEAFKPLRLQNGVYLQLHAYMLRVAVPYGQLDGTKLRTLAMIAERYDRGYGHVTTRQNIQFNWVALKDIPDILDHLAQAGMNTIQTSGNCIRNTTCDHFAGTSVSEIADPRPWCEIIRQWSSLHPEFAFLPRKFKIAVIADEHDRAAIRVHDIGLRMLRRDNVTGFEVHVGGGQGRTPMIASLTRAFIPEMKLLDYLEAIMRVYNRFGRRDNKYKARLKILVAETGVQAFTRLVEDEYQAQGPTEKISLPRAEIDRIHACFAPPPFNKKPGTSHAFQQAKAVDPAFADWAQTNLHPHKQSGYTSVTISLKPTGGAPGDITSRQMTTVAGIAERYGFDDIRLTHAQNIVLAHIALDDVYAVYNALDREGLATANEGLITDMIVCPGLDYCNLANARSIPVGQALQKRFSDPDWQRRIGRLHVNVSGCINACGHHHVGHVGILGVDRKGNEFYQISLGGRADEKARIGTIIGKALSLDDLPDAIEKMVNTYERLRTSPDEVFIDTLERVGHQPFREAVYGTCQERH